MLENLEEQVNYLVVEPLAGLQSCHVAATYRHVCQYRQHLPWVVAAPERVVNSLLLLLRQRSPPQREPGGVGVVAKLLGPATVV